MVGFLFDKLLDKEVIVVEIIGLLVVASYFAVISYFFMLMSSMEKSLKRIADKLDKEEKAESDIISSQTAKIEITNYESN